MSARWLSCAVAACRLWSSVAGFGLHPPFARWLKHGLSAFGPPRAGLGWLLGLLDGNEQRAGEGFHWEDVCAGNLDEFVELDGSLQLVLLGFVHGGLEFGVEVAWLPGHDVF